MCDSCDPGLHLLARALTKDLDLSGISISEASQDPLENDATTIVFFNGPIVTMAEGNLTPVEAMAIRGSSILEVGTLSEIQSMAGEETSMQDLKGRCILPGFVEPHLHLILSALANEFLANFSPPRIGGSGIGTLDEAERLVKEVAGDSKHKGKPEVWVAGYGYDPSRVENHPDLTRDLLDKWSPDNPVFIINQSGHLAYVNSLALAAAKRDEHNADPDYQRDSSGRLNGIIIEGAVAYVGGFVALPQGEELFSLCRDMLNNWASKGCTTIFDAGIGSVRRDVDGQILNKVTSVPIPVRFYGALAFQDSYKANPPKPPVTFGKVHVPAIKYWADGSTRGFTAALKHPYLNKEDKGKLKYPTVEDLRNNMEPLYLNGWQLMVHANGDAAIEQTLDVYELLFQSHPQKNKIVHRIEHFTVTETDDLIKKAARLGIGISHTILHVFYWGHTFKEWVLGAPRALRIDPVLEEVKAGALVSFHSDSPVSEVNPLLYVRTAVTRLMFARGDQDPLGKDQCVSLLQALAGITINPARQIGMGHQIGTLERGKLADFVVLDADPRSVPGPELDQIQVVETWMGGKRVWPA